MCTCLNPPTDRPAVKQATIVVHDVTHTSTYMEPHISNIKNIDAVLDIYPEENISKAITHQRHVNDQRLRVGDGRTPITKRDCNSGFLNNEKNEKNLFSFSSTYISKAGMGGTLLLGIRFEITFSNKHCDIKTPQHCNHSEANTVYDTYDKTGSYNSLFPLLSELWLDIGKIYCGIPVHTIYPVIGQLIHLQSCVDGANTA